MSPYLRRHSGMQAPFPMPSAPKHPGTGRVASQPVHCGICRSELEGEGLHRQEGREQLGSYCSPACLSAVEALVALQLWSAKLDGCGRRKEAEVRATLADDLLLAWRTGTGPDPKGVIAAVTLAQTRDGPHSVGAGLVGL